MMKQTVVVVGSIALLALLWGAIALTIGSCGGQMPGLVRPVVHTIEDIAGALCLQAEQEQRSPGDLDIDAYCNNRQVINAIVGTLLEAKRAARVRLAALPTEPATIGPAPVQSQPVVGDTGDP